MPSSPKKTRGRQKLELKKMSKDTNLQVTFSKRRAGLFKKASELCTLCGLDMALIVFSPGDKVFSFGTPHLELILDRYTNRALPSSSGTHHFIEAHRHVSVHDLHARLSRVDDKVEAEQKRSSELSRLKKVAQDQFWWAKSVDQMDLTQLERYQEVLEGLKGHVRGLANKVMLKDAPNIGSFIPEVSTNPVHQAHPPLVFPPPLIQPPMLENYRLGGGTMMHPLGFNNMGMGGYGPGGGHGFV